MNGKEGYLYFSTSLIHHTESTYKRRCGESVGAGGPLRGGTWGGPGCNAGWFASSRPWRLDSSDPTPPPLPGNHTESTCKRQCGESVGVGWPLRGRFRRSEERRVGKESRSRWSPYH